MEVDIVRASEQQIAAVQDLWREYWDSLGLPADFQGFAEECGSLPGKYALPRGRLLLALLNGLAAGTAALRPLSEEACEAKRLYVRPQYRGAGIGAALLKALINEARAEGYREMYGDTLKSMKQAFEMYERAGFSRVDPYSSTPTPDAIFLRLALGA